MRALAYAAAAFAAAATLTLATATPASADDIEAEASVSVGAPGLLGGNVVQIPIDVGVNLCGITANVLGVLNPAAGDACSNG